MKHVKNVDTAPQIWIEMWHLKNMNTMIYCELVCDNNICNSVCNNTVLQHSFRDTGSQNK